MGRNLKIIIITVLVTLAGTVALLEWRRSEVRADAVTGLNYAWAGLKTEAAKTAAVVKANTIIEQNRSLFDLSNLGASEEVMVIKLNSKTGKWEYTN